MAATASAPAAESRWWLPLVLGILAIIMGLMLWMNPVTTSVGFVLAIGLYWLFTGIYDLIRLFWDRTQWGWRLFTGIIGILAGFWISSGIINGNPLAVTFGVGSAFTWVLGIMGIIYGIIAIFGSFKGGGWVPAVLGVVGILFGFVILGNLYMTTLALPITLAILFVGGGIALIIAAFRNR